MTAGIKDQTPQLKKTTPTPDSSAAGNVRVVGRIRPLAKYEKEKGSKEVVTSMNSLVNELKSSSSEEKPEWTITTEPELIEAKTTDGGRDKRWFELDAVFDKNSTQEEVYIRSGAAKAVRTDIFKGYNATILAYGQTGAGKTFTMGTACSAIDENEDGIIPRACYDLYSEIQTKCDGNASVELSYLEIYNEEIHDLLIEGSSQIRKQHNTKLKIRETLNSEVYVSGLIKKPVKSPQDIGSIMEEASTRRITGATAMNAVSSRSHAICTLRISGVLNENDEKFTSKLTLVDLAGSERIKKTGAQGSRQKEGISINKGLFVLGQVVSALAEAGASSSSSGKKGGGKGGHHHHIKPPYRDSKLTRLLQDSLGGNSRTIMLACVSPADFNIDESINTLRYATSARNIKNTATRNVVKSISPEEAAQLRRENQLLKKQVSELQQTINSLLLQDTTSVGTPTSSAPPSKQASFASMDEDEDNISVITTPTTIATTCAETSSTSDNNNNNDLVDVTKEEENKKEKDNDGKVGGADKTSSSTPSSNDNDKDKRINELENEVQQLQQKLNGAQKDLLSSARNTAIAVPAMKMQIEQMKDKLADKEEIELENEILLMELEDARADAKSANIAASKLSDVLDQLRELREDEITKKKKDLSFMKKEEAWVMFVDTLLEKRQEQIFSLSEDFNLVLKVLDSPAVLKNHEKKNWFGRKSGEIEEIYSPELRQKVLREHVDFFKDRMDEMQEDIRVESYSMKQMRESIQSDCLTLENEIGDDNKVLIKGGESKNRQDMLSKLAKALSVSVLQTESVNGHTNNNNNNASKLVAANSSNTNDNDN